MRCTCPPASLIKSSPLNCKASTEHINNIKHAPKSSNLQLSNKPKNAKNGPELVEKLNYWKYLSFCIITQKLAIELLSQYWPHLEDLNLS